MQFILALFVFVAGCSDRIRSGKTESLPTSELRGKAQRYVESIGKPGYELVEDSTISPQEQMMIFMSKQTDEKEGSKVYVVVNRKSGRVRPATDQEIRNRAR